MADWSKPLQHIKSARMMYYKVVCPRACAIFTSILVALPLSGCETTNEQKVLSAEEAKQVAVELKDTDLGAPPRSLVGLGVLPNSLADISHSKDCVKPAERITTERLDSIEEELRTTDPRVTKNRGVMAFYMRGYAKKELSIGQLSNAIAYQTRAIETSDSQLQSHENQIQLANLYAKAGNFEQAEDLFEKSRRQLVNFTFRANKNDKSCQTKMSFLLQDAGGVIALARGDLAEAETKFAKAIDTVEELSLFWPSEAACYEGTGWNKADLRLGLSQARLWQGRTSEAEVLARQAYKITRTARADALVSLGDIYFEQGRFEDSLRVSLGAIERLDDVCAPSDALMRGRAYESVGRAYLGQHKWPEAAEAFERLEALMQTDHETWNRRFRVNRDRGIALLRTGQLAEARQVLQEVAQEQERRMGKDNYQTLETRAFLATALGEAGAHDEALDVMREVVPTMLTGWREGSGESSKLIGRMFRLKLIAETYLRLLLDPKMNGDPGDDARVAEAFQIADAVSTRGVHRALAESTSRSLAKDAATADLIRQRQNLEKQVAVLRNRLVEAYGSKEASTPGIISALEAKITTAAAALRGLDQEVAVAVPGYAALTNPKPVTLAEARGALEVDEALVLTFAGEDSLFAWAVSKNGPAMATVAHLGRERLKDTVDALRKALAPNIATLGDIPEFDLKTAHDLYAAMLGPLAPAWKKQKRLLVVADGPLGTLPLAVLPTEKVNFATDETVLFEGYRSVPWLARSHAIGQLPSVASLLALRQTKTRSEELYAFVGFGDPWFDRTAEDEIAVADIRGVMRGVAPAAQPIQLRSLSQTRAADTATLASLPRLPDTADEIRAVAEALGANLDRDVYLGLAASERRVKELSESGELKKYRTLSFATHGLVPGDLDGLVKPALAMAAPSAEAVALGDDGLLTSDEILGLKLQADWVVLSACNTAAADGAGAEAISGLGRAFFYAGAKAILVSNWPVHSDATTKLMTELFHSYAESDKVGRADALQSAMLHLIDKAGYSDSDGTLIFTYAHPIFWAPFTLVGDGGRV